MYTYLLNGFDFSELVYGTPTLTKKVGRGSQSLTNDLNITVINADNAFSAENENSLIYEFRDDYSKLEIEIKENNNLVWKGIIDNIIRDPLEGTITLRCVEITIKLLSIDEFSYYNGDGYVGDLAYAGDTATPADHMLAVLRRFIDDDNIDIGSLKVLKKYHTDNLVQGACEVRPTAGTKMSPLTFLQNLLLKMGYLGIYKNKIFVKMYEDFLGDYGVVLSDDQIIDISSISKSKSESNDPYYSYSITYNNAGVATTVEGSAGDSGTSTNLSSTVLTDATKEWRVNQWRDKYIFIGTADTKQILKITGNNKTQIFFAGCTKSSPQPYVIVENNKIYYQDLSDFPIKISSGAHVIGTVTITKNEESKLEIVLKIFDSMNLDTGDVVTFSIPDEGIVIQPFEITQLKKELFGDISTITCIDKIMYPLLESFAINVPVKVTGLVGYRQEDGSAVLSWSAVSGASYYRIYYGVTSPTYSLITPNHSNVKVSDHLERWLGYYFWVAAVNFYGMEGERSDSLYLDKISQDSGYIDGTEGYLVEKYKDWGRLEEYYYLLTYKNISNADISFLLKSNLDILDRSQRNSVREITQIFSDSLAIQKWGETFRRFGYIDGAGTSTYLPEFVSASGIMYLKNPLTKKLTLKIGGVQTVVEPDAIIPNSENWFLKDADNNYFTYWFQTGYMLNLHNADCLEWYKVFKTNQAMGLFAYGSGDLTVDEDTKIATLTDSLKTWIINQWEDYYVGIVENAVLLTITWYKITANTIHALTFNYGESAVSNQKYIINNEPYIGFHGLFIDDVWTNLYMEGVSSTAYETHYYNDNGIYYWQAVANFLEAIVEHIENNSYGFYDTWTKAEKGIAMINTWPDNWAAYPYYVAAVNKRYRHFIMFEALQSTWDMANEVTKQFRVLDWHETKGRWDLMKVSGGVGYVRLAVLGYPCHSQMMLSHIAGSLMLSRYSDIIEDITAAGNIVLDQLFYDMLMAGNKENLKTIGHPLIGYEDSYVQNQYDRYGIMVRKFEGAYVLYNPSKQIRTIEYSFDEDVVDFFNGNELKYGSVYNLIIAPMSALFFFKSSAIGEDAFNFLNAYNPFTYVDCNMAWIVFTPAGVTAIGTNSVWITNGYTGLKRLVLDGNPVIPEGTLQELFHAGNGSDTAVVGHTPLTEAITGGAIAASVQLTSLTILAIVQILTAAVDTWVVEDSASDCDWAGDSWLTDNSKSWTANAWAGKYVRINGSDPILITGNSSTVLWFTGNTNTGTFGYEIGHTEAGSSAVLVPNIDYLIEQKEWDVTASGKGKWKTYIYFLTNQSGVNLTIKYFEYGLDNGWPKIIAAGEQVEFGVLYRKNSGFALKTGAINQSGCSTTLVEGTHYFVIPEVIKHKWDYRVQPFGTFLEDAIFNATIYLNSIYAIGGNEDIKAIHWGNIDTENALLVNASQGDSDYGLNGKKATYTSKTILKPKVLIYGFSRAPRNNNLTPIAPASRVYDVWLFENQIKKMEGIYYDEVWITGDWDGVIKTGSALGAYGSIDGILHDSSTALTTWENVADYFDVIILNDTFMEYAASSPSGCTQWSSWLKENDYNLIKNFKKRALTNNKNTLLIDRRSSLTAFVWYGGIKPIQNELLNKGAELITGSPTYTDLTDVAGCLMYEGVSIEDLYNAASNIYIKSENDQYVKYNNKLLTDFRVGKIISATKHYDFDEDAPDEHPTYNIWENGGNWISYIPKTKTGRAHFAESKIISEMSHLYLKWYNLASLVETDFEKYNEIDLCNIPFRREPMIIFHSYDYFNVTLHPTYSYPEPVPIPSPDILFGRTGATARCYFLDAPILLSDVGKFRGSLFLKSLNEYSAFILNKQLFLHESKSSDYTSAFNFSDPKFKGYRGHYISSVEIPKVQAAQNYQMTDAGWIAWVSGACYFFEADAVVNWNNMLVFDSWNDEMQKVLPISKTFNANGVVSYERTDSAHPPIEGGILDISKNSDGTINIHVDFDTTTISADMPLASGTILSAYNSYGYGILHFSRPVTCFTTDIDLSTYNSYYIFIYYQSTIVIKQIFQGQGCPNDYVRYSGSRYASGYNQFYFGEMADYSAYVGCTFDIKVLPKSHKMATIQTDSVNNIVFNAPIISKNDTTRILKINLARGVSQAAAGGSLIAYYADEDQTYQNEDGVTKTKIGNRDILGGRVAGIDDIIGADIGNTFLSEGTVDYTKPASVLETTPIANKPSSLQHYEWAYGSIGWLEEFGYEKNTGLITCQAFYAHGGNNRPPVLIWPGISEEDIHTIINKMIGTKIVYNDLNVKAGDILYLYYNSFNDMLKINSEDVENPIDGFYKVGALRTSDKTLHKALARNRII